MSDAKLLIFICARSQAVSEKRLSHRIAMYMEKMGIGLIGNVQLLGEQHSLLAGQRRKMIFLNDCNSNCVKLLTNGFRDDEFVYLDVSAEKYSLDFDIEKFVGEIGLLQQITPEPSVPV